MNAKELSNTYLFHLGELLKDHSSNETNAILAETYLKLVKSMNHCTYSKEEVDQMEIVSLGTIAYYLHHSKP
jgi:hypothetical protein